MFKARFGMSATEWRRTPDQAAGPRALDDGRPDPTHPEVKMSVQLIGRSPARMAYRRPVGAYGPPVHAF